MATPVIDPKLEVTSLRTIPLCVRTLGPFEPSPGKGPAVSVGMVSQLTPVAVAGVEVGDPAPVVGVVPATEVEVALVAFCPELQPTKASTPAPARSFNVRRRSRSVPRS